MSPSESTIYENQSFSKRKKESREIEATPTLNDTKLEAVVVKDSQSKPKPEKPKLMVKPTVITNPTGKKPDEDGYSTAESDGEENQYYNTMTRSRKVRKEDLKDYITTAEANNELDKEYKVSITISCE